MTNAQQTCTSSAAAIRANCNKTAGQHYSARCAACYHTHWFPQQPCEEWPHTAVEGRSGTVAEGLHLDTLGPSVLEHVGRIPRLPRSCGPSQELVDQHDNLDS